MARWREPRPKSSPYITPEGERALKAELQRSVISKGGWSGWRPTQVTIVRER